MRIELNSAEISAIQAHSSNASDFVHRAISYALDNVEDAMQAERIKSPNTIHAPKRVTDAQINDTIEAHGGNVTKAAMALGVTRNALNKRRAKSAAACCITEQSKQHNPNNAVSLPHNRRLAHDPMY